MTAIDIGCVAPELISEGHVEQPARDSAGMQQYSFETAEAAMLPRAPPSAVIATAAELQTAAYCAAPQWLPREAVLGAGEHRRCDAIWSGMVRSRSWLADGFVLAIGFVQTVLRVPAGRAVVCQPDVCHQHLSSQTGSQSRRSQNNA